MDSEFKQMRIDVSKIIPNPKNPRVALREGMPLYRTLKDSVEHYGYAEPIIWNKRTGMIVSGHQRFQVMKDLAEEKGEPFDQVDVMVVDWDENKQDSFMIAVNKITGLWDMEKLSELLKELDEEDLKYTGYEDFEIEAITSGGGDVIDLGDDESGEIIPADKDESFKVTIYFETEDERNTIYREYKEKGYKVKM